jgi:hypothetical protein
MAVLYYACTTDVQNPRLHLVIFVFKMRFLVIFMARDLLSLMSGIAGRSFISHQPAFLWHAGGYFGKGTSHVVESQRNPQGRRHRRFYDAG